MGKNFTFFKSHVLEYEILTDTTPLVMTWEWKDVDSAEITVTGAMDTTVTITSNPGSFFTMSDDGTNYDTTDLTNTGDFTLYVKAAADNDDTINTGSLTISDDLSNADDLVISVTQQAAPV